MSLSVLVGCEESQTVAIAFKDRGFDAYSCDLRYCTGFRPDIHLQMDVFKAIELKKWDGIILHPPCTYTSLSSNRHYSGSAKRLKGALFTKALWETAINVCDNVALEQPMSMVTKYIGRKTQTIQPYQFGHGELKTTWLWLKGFPLLVSTDLVSGRVSRMHSLGPSAMRGIERSKTYPGIAEAMAQQWGAYLLSNRKK